MTAIGEGLGSWDLAGTSKEDVVEAAKNANAGAADNIAAANETGDALLTLVTTTSENLFTERRTSAATFGGISNKMFFQIVLLIPY